MCVYSADMMWIVDGSRADDVFEVNEVDPDGKKFTKGTAMTHTRDMSTHCKHCV